MKLRIFLIPTILIMVLLLSSCITSHEYSVNISCDKFTKNNNRTSEFEVEVGDKIRLKLCSNPTTGFQWDYKMTTENIVKEEDHDFEPPEGDLPGAAGTEFWTFEAVNKGTTEVRMEYSQPGEGGLKADWTYTMNITVE